MNTDEMNRELAKVAGYEKLKKRVAAGLNRGYYYWKLGREYKYTRPDYCNDLNALRQVEERLTDEQWTSYREQLLKDYVDRFDKLNERVKTLVHLTAAQKAEALCRALSL